MSHLRLGRDVDSPCRGVSGEEAHQSQLGAHRLAAAGGGADQDVRVSVVELLENLQHHTNAHT